MSDTRVDYCLEGEGKFVVVSLPPALGYETRAVISRMKKLSEELKSLLHRPVGYKGGDGSFLMEFFWYQHLDAEEISRALNQFLENHPDLTIEFQDRSALPLTGV